MTSLRSTPRAGVVALALLALAVWAAVAYRVTAELSPPGGPPDDPVAADVGKPAPASTPPAYLGLFRDPFEPRIVARPVPTPAATQGTAPPPASPGGDAPYGPAMTFEEALGYGAYPDPLVPPTNPVPPPVTIVGVVGRQVILETPDGGSTLALPGDVVGGVEVVSVTPSVVVLSYGGYDFSIDWPPGSRSPR